MDKWKDSELAKMKAGGNSTMKSFLEDRSAPTSGNIQSKYNSKQAALYKDKILTESQGGVWDEDKSPAHKHVSSLGSSHLGGATGTGKKSSRDFDRSDNGFAKSHTVDTFDTYQSGGGGGGSSGLPPSQGGRYSGFGNTDYNPSSGANRSNSVDNIYENSMGSLTNSWSALAIGASKLGQSMSEASKKVSEVATQKLGEVSGSVTEKVKEGQVLKDLSAQASSVAGMVGAVGKTGWSNLSSLWSQQSSYQQPSEQSSIFSSGAGGYNSSESAYQSSGGGGSSYQQQENDDTDWGKGWGGFEDDKGSSSSKGRSKAKRKDDDDDKLIDFAEEKKSSAAADNWDDDW